MTLTEYITATLKNYNLTFKPGDVEAFLYDKAREVKKGNCAVVDDDTVKDWILNYDPEYKKKQSQAEVAKVAENNAVVEKKNAVIKAQEKETKEKAKFPEKKKVAKDEQISIFDLL
jgi:hypothetical protein